MRLDDRYEILALAGEGGMGRVFRARHRTTRRIVAVKTVLEEVEPAWFARECLRREHETLLLLDCPGVPRAYERGTLGGRAAFAMQWVEGTAFDEWLAAPGRSWQAGARLVARAALRLERVHRAGFVHGDVKPENLLVDARGEPWWIDFGIGSRLGDATPPGTWDAVFGTPPFMPPERAALPPVPPTAASDVYSLGALLRLALGPEDAAAGPWALARARLAVVAWRALSPAPMDRPASAQELAGGVLALLTGPAAPDARPLPLSAGA